MFKTLLLTVLFISCASAQVINLANGEEETGNFLESGFITLSATDTITISTTNAFTYPIVFLSTPFASNGYTDEIPLGARVEELLDNSGAEEIVTFQVKLIWPSNKTCVSEWNDGGIPAGTFSVGWYVTETGGYSVSGVQIEFITTSVNALDWNLATWPYTFGTDCNYPSQDGDGDYSPGAVFTIQSDNNAGQYLTVRASSWFKTDITKCNYAWAGGHMRLYPHDYDANADLINIHQIQDETVGVFLFDTRFPQSLDCVAGSYLEIGQVDGLTSSPIQLNMYQPVDTSNSQVGVFGSTLTLNGGEAMMIMSYALSSSPSDIFTYIQEDKCIDEETIHYPESFSYFIATPTTNIDCDADDTIPILGEHTFAPTILPTPPPTLQPTIAGNGDGGDGGDGDGGEGGSDESGDTTAKQGDILLAVFLPICIIIVVAIVGLVTKKVFLTPPPPADTSDHSGIGLVP